MKMIQYGGKTRSTQSCQTAIHYWKKRGGRTVVYQHKRLFHRFHRPTHTHYIKTQCNETSFTASALRNRRHRPWIISQTLSGFVFSRFSSLSLWMNFAHIPLHLFEYKCKIPVNSYLYKNRNRITFSFSLCSSQIKRLIKYLLFFVIPF